jgi:hypothetical protein
MLLLALSALSAQAVPGPGWREFDRRQQGWAESPALYDEAGMTSRDGIVRVQYRYVFHTSGVPEYEVFTRVALDCARRWVRVVEIDEQGGPPLRSGGQAPPIRPRAGYVPIEVGSLQDALARRVCPAR